MPDLKVLKGTIIIWETQLIRFPPFDPYFKNIECLSSYLILGLLLGSFWINH